MEASAKIKYDLTWEEKQRIIRAYAQKICRLSEYYELTLHEIEALELTKDIRREEEEELLEFAHEKFDPALGRLMIEQYYNTSDEEMFDRALMMDEHVSLDLVSYISRTDLDEANPGKNPPDIVLFYQGFFFRLDGRETGNGPKSDLLAIVRDPGEVEMINRKIVRAQTMLEIDEATLGRRYYKGLCRRTHYRYYQ